MTVLRVTENNNVVRLTDREIKNVIKITKRDYTVSAINNNAKNIQLKTLNNKIYVNSNDRRDIRIFSNQNTIVFRTTQRGQTGSFKNTFEIVSKNLNAWNAEFNYTGDQLTSIVYTDGVSTITKTLNYTGSNLTSLVLSGDTPEGINLTKTLSYTGTKLTGASYS